MSREKTDTTGRRSLFKRTVLYTLGDGLARGQQLILIPLFAAYLPPSQYGILALATVVRQILRPTLSLGLQAAALRFYYLVGESRERRGFYGDLWLFYLVGVGSLFLVADMAGARFWVRPFSDVPYSPFIRLSLWTAFLAAAFLDLPRQLFRASGRPVAYGILATAQFTFTVSAAVWFVAVERQEALGAVKASLIGTGLTAVGCAAFLVGYARPALNWTPIRKALVYSLPMVPHFTAHWVLNASDRMVLEWFVPLDEVGVYSLGYTIGWAAVLAQVAIMNSLVPVYGRLRADDPAGLQELAELLRLYVGALVACYAATVLFAGDVLSIVAPAEYTNATNVIPWIAMGAVWLGLYAPSAQLITISVGHSRLIGVATIGAATLNLAMNLVLVPHLGMIGAAVTTLITYLLLALAVLFFAQSRIRIPYDYRRILGLLLLSGVLLVWAVTFAPTAQPSVVARVGAFLGALFIIYWIGLRRTATKKPSAL